MLDKVLQRNQPLIRLSFEELTGRQPGEYAPLTQSPAQKLPTTADKNRQRRIKTAKELFEKGLHKKEIARRLGCNPKTISRDLASLTPLIAVKRPRPSLLDPYKEYLHQRVQSGCYNVAHLFQEIKSQGFPGKITIVREFLKPRRLKRFCAAHTAKISSTVEPLAF